MNFRNVVRRKAYPTGLFRCGIWRAFFFGTAIAVLGTVFLSGCVRVAGTAGYWHSGQDGQLESKQAGFDTNELVQKGKTPGSITV